MPIRFVTYTSSLYDMISKSLPFVHADYHQLYISFNPDTKSTAESVIAMEQCVNDIIVWMLMWHAHDIQETSVTYKGSHFGWPVIGL